MKGKGNDGSGNNEKRDSWETEQAFWDVLNNQYTFDYDCCASELNKKTTLFSSDFESVSNVEGIAWMNPPFSKAKEMFNHFFKVIKKGVAIYRFDNAETSIWQNVIFPNASWVFVPKGRISYTPFSFRRSNDNKGTRFPSVLVGVGVDVPKGFEGRILLIQQKRCRNENRQVYS